MFDHKTHPGLRRLLSVWARGPLVLAVLLSAAPSPLAAHAKLAVTTKSYPMPNPLEVFGPILDDLSQSGLMLFNIVPRWVRVAKKEHSILDFIQMGELKPSLQVELPEMAGYAQQAGNYGDIQPGPFRFSGDGKSVIGIQIPWLVLISLEARREIRRVRPCQQELLWMRSTLHEVYPPTPEPRDDMRIAISPRGGVVAASCVVKGGSELVILDVELKGTLDHWIVPRPVQDLAWSPDGKELAVLYYDPPYPWDPKTGKWVGPPSPYPVKPNVAIFDSRSGKELRRFNTSAFDAKISFSPDGSRIYSISRHHFARGYFSGDWRRETLRAFDSRTGEMKKCMIVPGTGVRDNFAVSPDGRLLVAESTKDVSVPFWREPGTTFAVDYGFVILDSTTGDVLFREKLRRAGYMQIPLPLFFSADGKQVVANFNPLPGRTYVTDINVYSLGAP